ncbi:UNVERIFIED_CONTAM: hypothetical protein Slati_3945800 [Sesamum latifolium]|uniref:Uncharacterized protein n=1 Tax=Sesamum latifolium TaxID=2727402 RepID=A0AAW2TPB2_9LAMI
MYEKNLPSRAGLTLEFEDGVTAFIEYAKFQHAYMDGGAHWVMQCRWIGRRGWFSMMPGLLYGFLIITRMVRLMMIRDRFHDVIHAVEQPLWNGCTQSQLVSVVELVNIKKDNIDRTTASFVEKLGTSRPESEILTARRPRMPFLGTCCLLIACRGCMLQKRLPSKRRGMPTIRRGRDPCAIRLMQRYGHFLTYHDFEAEPRNVRLSLWTDGFAPIGQYGRTYSCLPVILTPYNLPSGMYMSSEYMFLTMVIPDPSNPKYLIDVYLEPLIEELQNLSHAAILIHDNAKNKTFTMHAALM